MKAICALILLLLTSNLQAQSCKCEDELNYVINYYEENLPGFIDNVNDKNINIYTDLKNEWLQQAKKYCNKKNDCYKVLLTYVEFFKDNHSSISQNSVFIDETKKEEVDKFINSNVFKETEVIDLKFQPQNPIENIENCYVSNDDTYTVTIVKNKNSFRDYVGVITHSKTPLWVKGQVKFELKNVGNNTFDMFVYMRNHSVEYQKNVKLINGILSDSWFNVTLKNKVAYNVMSENKLTFKAIDSETNYLSIPTFSGNWFAKLDAFYTKYDSIIQSKPYLIIDVRNNGGGSDECVYPLSKYLYTKPFYNDIVDIYVTKETIRKSVEWYEMNRKDTINFDHEFLKDITDEIEAMKAAPNKTFIRRSDGEETKLDSILRFPSKIAIIMNKNCASSCETLLFWAKESDKTILVGENSGGYVGYGEIGEVNTPNLNFKLGCTMTRYTKQRAYEVIGISPNYYLTNESDWLQQTIKILKKK